MLSSDGNGKGVRHRGERLSKSPQCLGTQGQLLAPLRFVRDDFWRRFIHFELRAHFLDLRGLLFELGRQNFHPFLLLRDGGFQVPALSCAL